MEDAILANAVLESNDTEVLELSAGQQREVAGGDGWSFMLAISLAAGMVAAPELLAIVALGSAAMTVTDWAGW